MLAAQITVAGLAVYARRTGRVLMLQRALDDKDPASGMLEFPGGHLEPGEDPLDGARREFQEETGAKLPPGDFVASWISMGIYQGFLYVVEEENLLRLNQDPWDRHVLNPDMDPDGDLIEIAIWMDPAVLPNNPAVRSEVRKGTDWKLFRKAIVANRETDSENLRQFGIRRLLERAQASGSGFSEDEGRSRVAFDRTQMPKQGPWAPQAPGDTPGEQYPTATVRIKPGNKKIKVRVANTPALRQMGVQNTSDADAGDRFDPMLFHWPDGETQATLHNAGVNYPVSAYFFDSSGMYRDHFNMLPNDGTSFKAKAPHRYALEVHPDDADSLGLSSSSQIAIEHDAKDTTKSGTVS